MLDKNHALYWPFKSIFALQVDVLNYNTKSKISFLSGTFFSVISNLLLLNVHMGFTINDVTLGLPNRLTPTHHYG